MENNSSTKRYPDGSMALWILLMELYDVFTIYVRVLYVLVFEKKKKRKPHFPHT